MGEKISLRDTSAVRGNFRHMMEKDQRKSNLKLIFQLKKKAQKCLKVTIKDGEIRTCPKIVVQPAVTSEKGVVNPVRSGSGSDDESVADNFLIS